MQQTTQPKPDHANPASAGRTLITLAAQGCLCEVFKAVDGGVHPDACPTGKPSALCYATLNGDAAMARYLIACGANPDFQDALGNTPGIYATLSGNLECLYTLLSCGADLSINNHQGLGVYHYADCAKENRDTVKRLLHSTSPAHAIEALRIIH